MNNRKLTTAIQKSTFLGIFISLFLGNKVIAEEKSLWDMDLETLGNIRLTDVGSGTNTPLDKAAAVATVITDEDIEAMGATNIDEVLESVPGLHVTQGEIGIFGKYVIRGITSQSNPQTLVMVNGLPINSYVFGNRQNGFVEMPVKSIKRIDVIRGPGSALYGADAFAGVINITTKGVGDIKQQSGGVSVGSFDTYRAWGQGFTNVGDLDIAATLEVAHSNGHDEIVDEDAQSGLDNLMGTSASLAPGPANRSFESVDANINIVSGLIDIKLGFQGRYNVGTGIGVTGALDPESDFKSERIMIDGRYGLMSSVDGLESELRFSGIHATQVVPEDGFLLYPAGATFAVDLGPPVVTETFENGVVGGPGLKEYRVHLDLNNVYSSIEDHIVRFGAGAARQDAYEITEHKNFNEDFSEKPETENVDDDSSQIYLSEESRNSYHAYIQDEWKFRHDWQLTSGLRYDHYSDFGGAVNPRIAMIWATTDTLTTKILYGRAFRAPVLQESHVKNNPAIVGNSDLRPEKIDSYEIGLYNQPNADLLYSANFFYYDIKDYITFVPGSSSKNEAKNVGRIKGYGSELEIRYDIDKYTLVANYAYQRSIDQDTDEDVGDAPNHQFYIRNQLELDENLDLNVQLNWVGKQKRVSLDSRESLDDYSTVDFNLIKSQMFGTRVKAKFAVKNAFNADVREPSTYGAPFTALPNDIPMAGRSYYLEISSPF